MAVRALRLCIVFTIGFYIGPAHTNAEANSVLDVLTLELTDPPDVTVTRKQSATLKCDARSSYPNLRYEWFYNDEPISKNDTRRQIRPDGSLYIHRVAGKRFTSLEGEYRCRVTNNVGSLLSGSAKLKIAVLGHDFIEQPKDISVTEGQPVIIPCRIYSIPMAAKIQWERDDLPLPQNKRYVPLPTGALLITSTNSSDGGFYRCRATLLNKSRSSKEGQLTVLPPITNAQPPQFLPLEIKPNVTVLVGETLTLFCPASGWPNPNVQWHKNTKFNIGNSSVLILRNVSQEATGNYSCLAHNSKGHVSKTYNVQVFQKPYFNVTPVSKTYPLAQTIRLDCQAKGVPKPQIYWLKDGAKLIIKNHIKQQPSGLVFSHSLSSDKGLYQCVAVNSVGSVWVAARPIIYSSGNKPSPPGNVRCRTFDETSICLQWAPPSNVSIQAYTAHLFHAEPGPVVPTNNTHHQFKNLAVNTNYTFYVRVYSNRSSDESKNVTCLTGSQGDRNLQIETLTNTSVELKWNELSSDVPCGSTIGLYRVQWRRMNQSSVNVENLIGFKKVIAGLNPSALYEFRVTSTTNKNDDSKWITYSLLNENNTFKTDFDSFKVNLTENTAVPDNLEANPVSSTSVHLIWTTVRDESSFYTVCFIEKDEGNCENGTLLKSTKNSLIVNNLKPSTLYEFKVRSQNLDEVSPFSHSLEVRTPADVPSEVRNLKYKIVNSTTVCFRWDVPLVKNGKLIKYMVAYTQNQTWPLENWQQIIVHVAQRKSKACWLGTPDTVSVLVKHLKPNEEYAVVVKAATEAGYGNAIRPVLFSTRNKYLDVGDEDDDYYSTTDGSEDIYYKQKLGIILGLVIAFTCVILCISCIIFRKRCVKRQALARARLAASNNYYPPDAHIGNVASVQIRNEEQCTAEAHEMQQLVCEESTVHIPPITPTHLDTKGGTCFPNGQLNGNLKNYQNGHIPNGHVHITENPRFFVQDATKLPLEEDSNSNLQNSKYSDFKKLYESSRSSLKAHSCDSDPLGERRSGKNGKINHECINNGKPGKVYQCNSANLKYSDLCDSSFNKSLDASLNCTQLTCLNDSLSLSPHRRVSPVLGPNG